jgi:tetratricopeptide (TPR) repeat protein
MLSRHFVSQDNLRHRHGGVVGFFSIPLLCIMVWFCLEQGVLAQSPSYFEAQQRHKNKEYLAAMVAAQKAVQEDGNNPHYRHLYGSILVELKQFTEAEENLRKSVALDPENADFLYSLGAFLLQQKMAAAISLQLSSGVKRPRAWLIDAEGLKALERAVAVNPSHLKARLHLGRMYYEQNRHDLAMEQFESVLKKDPRYPWVHSHIAVIHMNAGAVKAAIRDLKTELQLHPSHASARLELGEAFLKAGQPSLAVDQFIAAQKQDSELSEQAALHYGLGKAYQDLGQPQKAIHALHKCTEVDPSFPDAHYLLARLLQEAGQSELSSQEMEIFQRLKQNEN